MRHYTKDIITHHLVFAACMLIILLINIPCADAGKSFYQGANKYRGFYWLEKSEQQNAPAIAKNHDSTSISPEEASRSLKNRERQLNDARSVMIELSYREDLPAGVLRDAIVKYKKLESQMYNSAINLVNASQMANFTHPELNDTRDNPTNVFANKIKRKAEYANRVQDIKQFAASFDLLIFTSDTCPYSKAFVPVVTNFAKIYGFALEQAPLNGKVGGVAHSLGITSTPTLVAVSKDATQLFEISRGMSSLSELEQNIVLSSKYSDEIKSQQSKQARSYQSTGKQ